MSTLEHIAIVVPRYGEQVNGGIEALARDYAIRLAEHMQVTVLTTCALDYRTWADHFEAGETDEDGVRVLRFPVPTPRDEQAFDAISLEVLNHPDPPPDEQRRWMDAQGPVSPALEHHLRDEAHRYDRVLFMPYLYATTARGIPLVGNRAVLLAAVHDEPPLRLRLFDDLFGSVDTIITSTPEERALLSARFGIPPERCHVIGAGIDAPPAVRPSDFAEAFGIKRPYVVSVGRIDPSKGVNELIAAHRAYRARNAHGADLVLVGRSVMDLPLDPWLHVTGFVDDITKHQAMAGAAALATASPYESLSLVLLESWAHGRPVVVTAKSDVLVGQVRRSGGGLVFADADEYSAAIELLTSRPPLSWGLGRAGWRFSQQQDWPQVIDRLQAALANGS
jgi:glycosyltransferase involved in cell wall biosynthesis